MKSRTWGRVLNFQILAALIAATLAACEQDSDSMFHPGTIVFGGTRQIKEVQPVAGFLPDSSLLRPGGSGQPALVYRNPTANFALYNKVFLDPVTIWTAPNSALNRVPESARQAAANRFYSDLYKALSKRCQMVTSPSLPGTMHLRVALTDATTANAFLNTVATYAPYGVSTAYSLASLAFNNGVGYFAGTAAAEGYATDAMTGTVLWQAVDKRGGSTALIANTLNSWRDVDKAFRTWSDKLGARLQALGACRGSYHASRAAIH
jgi:hypothetical protein